MAAWLAEEMRCQAAKPRAPINRTAQRMPREIQRFEAGEGERRSRRRVGRAGGATEEAVERLRFDGVGGSVEVVDCAGGAEATEPEVPVACRRE